MQSLFKKNMCQAAHEVLDGRISSKLPTMHEMIEYWNPAFNEESVPMDEIVQVPEAAELMDILAPVTEAEVNKISIPSNSALTVS